MAADEAKYIRLRYAGRCATCDRELARGVWAFHYPAARRVRCQACVTSEENERLGIASSPAPEAPAEPPPVEPGVAGSGARRRYEQLVEAREQRTRAKYGDLGVAVSRIFGEPQHIKAWKTGAEGEERLAAFLEKRLEGSGVRLLHDRRIPMSRANIDHIAIGPGGVTVIDTKNLKGRVRVRSTGGLLRPRNEQLRVDGRDKSGLLEGMERQLKEVRAALIDIGSSDVDLAGVLCFVDNVGLPLFGTMRARGVHLLKRKQAAKLAARAGTLSPDEVEALTEALARRFPAH